LQTSAERITQQHPATDEREQGAEDRDYLAKAISGMVEARERVERVLTELRGTHS
jgi:hypothetical protein